MNPIRAESHCNPSSAGFNPRNDHVDDESAPWKALHRTPSGVVWESFFLENPSAAMPDSNAWTDDADVLIINQLTGEFHHEQGNTFDLMVWEINRREEAIKNAHEA